MTRTGAAGGSGAAVDPSVAVHSRQAAYAILGMVTLVWGVHWAVMKIGLGYMPPLSYGVLRVVGGLAVVTGILAARRNLRRPPRADLPIILTVGLGSMAGTIALNNFALQLMPVGRASIIQYTMPLWVAVFGGLFFQVRLRRAELAGVGLGLAGLALLLNPATIDWSAPGQLFGVACLLGSATIWALVTIHIRRHTWHSTPLQLQPFQLLVALAPLAVLAFFIDAGQPIDWQPQTLLVLLYSGPLATAFAYWGSQAVARSVGPVATTTGFLAVPVVALLTGSLVLREPLTAPEIGGVALILCGVAVTSLGGRMGRPSTEPAASETAG